ncbi:MAG: histidine phosphatase family protein [Fibrobacter sp.]|nr:histidine phosphatase family protein [Fibrobacter sp.]
MDWSKNTIKFLSAACIAVFLISATACGDDSSSGSPADPNTEQTSGSSSGTESGDGAGTEQSSTSEALISATITTERSLPVVADSNGFFDVADIYKAAPSSYKIAFVLRHAERESGLGQESPLTEVGVQQAIDLGKKLAGGDESFYYASTDFIRTRETCNNIAKGRGETGSVTETQADLLNGSYFLTVSSDSLDAFALKKGGGWKIISAYAYGEDYYAEQMKPLFYDFFERGNQFIMENIVANMNQWKRVSVLVTHDILIEPLVVYASNRTVDVNYYKSRRWVNYMTGIAVVLNGNSQVELYPVRGTEIGFMMQGQTTSVSTDSTDVK